MISKNEERRRAYFSSLTEGDIIEGEVVEYIDDHLALVEINRFLVRCIMKKKVPEGAKVKLLLKEKNPEKNIVILKVL